MKHLQFTDEHGSFSIEQPENTSYLYFPLASEKGLKSSVTPNLGGDAKIDQETFLLEQKSIRKHFSLSRSAPKTFIITVPSEISGWYLIQAKYSPRPIRSVCTTGSIPVYGASGRQQDHGGIHVAFNGKNLQKPVCPNCRYFLYTCE